MPRLHGMNSLMRGLRRWMKRLWALLILAVLLLILALLRPSETLVTADGTRVYVVDGDSLRIGPRDVRLKGIDAVELRQSCNGADGGQWSCGVEARQALQDLVARGDLRCQASEGDQFGRAIALCSVTGVSDVAAALVVAGWAMSGDGARAGDYADEQRRAKSASKGIWRGTFERPAEWRKAHPRDAEE